MEVKVKISKAEWDHTLEEIKREGYSHEQAKRVATAVLVIRHSERRR